MDDYARKISIELMEARHVEQVSQIEKRCFSAPWSFESFVDELSNMLAVYFVAEIDGIVVGFAGMHHIVDEGSITNIAVLPEYRRHGIARKLFKALDTYAKKNDLVLITLEVRKTNDIAINFYADEGFEKCGERKGYYREPNEDAILMTKRY